jgi:hypothetical protein
MLRMTGKESYCTCAARIVFVDIGEGWRWYHWRKWIDNLHSPVEWEVSS